jgi:hypothetical protein
MLLRTRAHKRSYRITRHPREHRGGRRLIMLASFDPAAVAVLRLAAVALVAALLLTMFR